MSDNEKLLTALVNETDVNDFKPNSRFETMLKACCCGEDCGLEPKTRNEYLLKQLQEKSKNSSSSESVNPLQALVDGRGEYGGYSLCNYFKGDNVDFLKDIDFSKTTSMANMFYGAENITAIPQLKNISNVNDITAMCYNCANLATIPPWDTSKIVKMQGAFNKCSNLKKVVLNTDSATGSMSSLFRDCTKMEIIDITKVNTDNFGWFAQQNYNLKKLIIRQLITIPTILTNMFYRCYHFTGEQNATYNPEGLRDGRIYVPDDKVDELKAATGWSDFADIIVPLSTLDETA